MIRNLGGGSAPTKPVSCSSQPSRSGAGKETREDCLTWASLASITVLAHSSLTGQDHSVGKTGQGSEPGMDKSLKDKAYSEQEADECPLQQHGASSRGAVCMGRVTGFCMRDGGPVNCT